MILIGEIVRRQRRFLGCKMAGCLFKCSEI